MAAELAALDLAWATRRASILTQGDYPDLRAEPRGQAAAPRAGGSTATSATGAGGSPHSCRPWQ